MFLNSLKTLTIPRFELPTLVSAIGHKLPQWPHSLALAAGLNALLAMRLFPEETVQFLEGRRILVEVQDIGWKISFGFSEGRFHPFLSFLQSPDVSFRANLSAFLQILARQEDPDTLFFKRELVIEGNTELGLVLKNMIDCIEWPPFSDMVNSLVFRH